MKASTPVDSHTKEMEAALGSHHRLTRQRKEVYEVLLERRDHPTATELFMRLKERMPSISLATVYNCLETLTQAGLVRQVTLHRSPSRYCPNLEQHGHFHCSECGSIADINYSGLNQCADWTLPEGARFQHMEVTIRGLCPVCAAANHQKN